MYGKYMRGTRHDTAGRLLAPGNQAAAVLRRIAAGSGRGYPARPAVPGHLGHTAGTDCHSQAPHLWT